MQPQNPLAAAGQRSSLQTHKAAPQLNTCPCGRELLMACGQLPEGNHRCNKHAVGLLQKA